MTDADPRTNDELLADVLALTTSLAECNPEGSTSGTTVLIPRGPLHDQLRDVLDAPSRLRRTRAGRWVIDGRTYRTKRLALTSAQDRFMAPLWPRLLASGRRFVLAGKIDRVEIKGVLVQ